MKETGPDIDRVRGMDEPEEAGDYVEEAGYEETEPEKKGIVEKVKAKLYELKESREKDQERKQLEKEASIEKKTIDVEKREKQNVIREKERLINERERKAKGPGIAEKIGGMFKKSDESAKDKPAPRPPTGYPVQARNPDYMRTSVSGYGRKNDNPFAAFATKEKGNPYDNMFGGSSKKQPFSFGGSKKPMSFGTKRKGNSNPFAAFEKGKGKGGLSFNGINLFGKKKGGKKR